VGGHGVAVPQHVVFVELGEVLVAALLLLVVVVALLLLLVVVVALLFLLVVVVVALLLLLVVVAAAAAVCLDLQGYHPLLGRLYQNPMDPHWDDVHTIRVRDRNCRWWWLVWYFYVVQFAERNWFEQKIFNIIIFFLNVPKWCVCSGRYIGHCSGRYIGHRVWYGAI